MVHDPSVLRKGLVKRKISALRFMIGIPGSVRVLKRLIRSEGVDLVHTNTGVALGGALAARRCAVPHVWHFREIFPDFGRMWKLYEPFVVRYSSNIVCISEAVRDQFQSESALAKTSIIYDGVDTPMVPEDSIGRSATGRKEINILCSGRINQPVKGQDILVRAAGQLVDRGYEIKVRIIGDVFPGKEYLLEELKLQIESLGLGDTVIVAGFQHDVVSYIDESDMVVVPSTHAEGFGIVVLEAFARGRPVIGSRIGGIPEIIEDGINGLLVTPGDADALADAIAELCDHPDLRSRLSRAARSDLDGRFSPDETVNELTRLYQAILSKNA